MEAGDRLPGSGLSDVMKIQYGFTYRYNSHEADEGQTQGRQSKQSNKPNTGYAGSPRYRGQAEVQTGSQQSPLFRFQITENRLQKAEARSTWQL